MKLDGKIAVVTGGNSGIGLAIARDFKAQGATVVITGRNEEALKKASEELGGVVTVVSDVSEVGSIDKIYEATAKLGPVDILVVNAGVASFTPLDSVTEKDFDYIADINFKGAFFTVQKAVPHLNEGASVVLIASAVDIMGMQNFSVYSATKAAIRSLARSLSADLLPLKNVRVNVLSPGPIETPIFEKFGMSEQETKEMGEQFAEMVPMKRFGSADEMAKAATFLASSDSSYMAGAEVVADGGISQL